MIDALKRNPQCEDVYRCLVFKEIRSCISMSRILKVLSEEEEEEEEDGALLEPAFATRDAAKKITIAG